ADVPGAMVVKVGEKVTDGQIVAQSKSFFGMFKSEARANTTGVLEAVSEITGQITLREAPIPVEVDAYVDGTVIEVMPKEGVVVETAGAFIQGIFGVGGETSGKLKRVVESPDQVLDESKLPADCKGLILVGGSQVNRATIQKARERGARGIVVGGIDAEELRLLLGYDLGVAITGNETIGITVVVTEGFGRLTMAKKTFELLGRMDGQGCSINGATQIRAGVQRPEILVPLLAGQANHAEADFAGGLDIGSSIRVIREPYFGHLGSVTELPPELQALETESHARVLKVRFADGKEAVVPRANVEMIEG
ncbi:MAG TPA: hypothetical protein VF720_02395, partial [Candidatus Eisenbacteria bacterium]